MLKFFSELKISLIYKSNLKISNKTKATWKPFTFYKIVKTANAKTINWSFEALVTLNPDPPLKNICLISTIKIS